MKANCERILVILGALIIIALTIGLSLYSNPNEKLLPSFSLAQLTLSAVAFFAIFITLYFTIVQFRKAMAKPKLEVTFTTTSNSECAINILPKKEDKKHLRLSVINKGNAITDLFQIDFDIPEIFNPTINSNTVNSVHHHKNGVNRMVSFLNKHEYVCFVTPPTPIPSLVLETHDIDYDKYPNHLVIPYKVFGYWSKPCEGKLKIIFNKEYKEVSKCQKLKSG